MCECYQVGGRFIAEDPDCPIHGTEAQWRREELERERQSLEDRVEQLEQQVARLEFAVQQLMLTGNE